MIFLALMVLGVLLLAGNVIFFSVWGLAQTFTFTALFWGTAIETVKLIIASFLYRWRHEITNRTKIFGWILVIGMMIITSFGIYGHILAGYQQKESEIQAQELRVSDAKSAIDRFNERISDITLEIDSTREEISVMNTNISDISTRDDAYITARSRAAEVIREDRRQLQEQLDNLIEERERVFIEREPLRERLITLEAEMLDVETKVGPIVTLIEMLGATGERAVLWFILLIVFVFDPAAVYLTIQANRVALKLKEEKLQKARENLDNEDKMSEEEILAEVKKQLPDSDNQEILDIVKELSDSSKKTSATMEDIQNKIDRREKRDKLKKQILKD